MERRQDAGDAVTVTLVVDAEQFDDTEVRVEGQDYRHLFRARRLAVGSEIRLTDGAGRVTEARIAAIDASNAVLEIAGDVRHQPPPPRRDLIVPLLKPQRTGWLVEKATELEVTSISFYSGSRAPRTLTDSARSRLERIAVAAVEQSHGAWVPRIAAPQPLDRVVAGIAADVPRLQCIRGGSAAPRSCATAVWAIGAEGGWTSDETETLQKAGFAPTGLGRTVLRAETAAVAALSLSAACAAGD